MLPLLVLVHVALALAMVFARGLATPERARVVRVSSLAGAASGLWLFLARGSGTVWGTFTLDDDRAAAAAAAVFCAWLLVGATDDGRGQWEAGALVGAAAAASVAFALTDWMAPALLFWVCISAATLVATREPGGSTLLVVGLSDALVVGALVVSALQEETWRMPDGLGGWVFYLAVAGCVLRAGVLPRIGPWDLAKGGGVALIPLLIGAVFALIPSLSRGGEIAVGLPLLLAGILGALWFALRSPQIAVGAGWLVATMLALVFIEPVALGKAAVAAVLGASAALLWPWAGGRAGPERGLLLAAVPLTAGFGPIVGGATASFQRAATADTILDGAPWTAFSALLPVALAVGVTVGGVIARRVEPETFRPAPVLATWAIVTLALVLGLTGGAELGLRARPELWLYVVAAVIAGVAARFAPRQPILSDVVATGPALGVLVLPASVSSVAARMGVASVGVAFVAALWFTYTGLKVGFL